MKVKVESSGDLHDPGQAAAQKSGDAEWRGVVLRMEK